MFDHGKCTTYAVVKLKPEKKSGLIDSNSWSLRYQCSVLPTELSSQPGAGSWAGSPVIITQSLIVLLNCDFSCLQDLSLLAWLVTRCLATVCLVTRSTQLQEWSHMVKVRARIRIVTTTVRVKKVTNLLGRRVSFVSTFYFSLLK